eukprot:scaffold39121_cov139-Skeletonema_marinoi.AAC.2
MVNLGLIVCNDSYVEKALPECDVSVLNFFEEDDGQTKSPLCSTKLSMASTSGISQPALLFISIENYWRFKRMQDRIHLSNTLWEVPTRADFRKFPGGARIFSKQQPSR